MIQIDDRVSIPEDDLEFTTARSGGPGGQNVNKVETKVTLWFALADTEALSPAQKARIRETLSGRISKDGRLRVSSQRHRTQAANRAAALERFRELLASALRPVRRRRATGVPKREKRKRLTQKRKRSEVKRLRSSRRPEE